MPISIDTKLCCNKFNLFEMNMNEIDFQQPKKMINSPEDLEKFKKSATYSSIMEFICELQASVTSKKKSNSVIQSKFQPLIEMLADLEKWVDEIPPIQQPMRFGNKAFRSWHDRLSKVMKVFLFYKRKLRHIYQKY